MTGINTFAFSGVSLQGAAARQEDIFYIDPQSGTFLLVDTAAVQDKSGIALARASLSSFMQATRRGQPLVDWLVDWNREVWTKQQKLPVSERATASLLAGRFRQDKYCEFVLLGRVDLWRLNTVEALRLGGGGLNFPLESLGVREHCVPHWSALELSVGDWLLGSSGDFTNPQFAADIGALRDFLLSQDPTSAEFRSSAERFTKEKMLAPQFNSSLFWMGLGFPVL